MKKTLKTVVIPIPPVNKGRIAEDLTGRVFGRLTVIGLVHIDYKRRFRWLCKCECGRFTNSLGPNLRRGTSSSCGCYATEVRSKHGDADNGNVAPEYNTLHGMIDRCSNPNSEHFHEYGGRGIKVCDEWNSLEKYESFLAYMGRKPSPEHSIDRFPNPDGNYEPGNVRWATKQEQAENRKSSIMLTFRGETMCSSRMARTHGLKPSTLTHRLNKGMELEKALTTPIDPKFQHFKTCDA